MTLSKNDYLKKGDTYLRVIEVLGRLCSYHGHFKSMTTAWAMAC